VKLGDDDAAKGGRAATPSRASAPTLPETKRGPVSGAYERKRSKGGSLYRLVFALGLFICGAFGVFVFGVGASVRSAFEDRVDQEVVRVGKMFASAARGPLISYDFGSLERFEAALLDNPDLSSASFKGTDGARLSPNEVPHDSRACEKIYDSPKPVGLERFEIKDKDQVLGVLEIEYHHEGANREYWTHFWSLVRLSLIFAATIVGTTTFLLKKRVIARLASMRNTAGRIRSGDLSARVEESGADEIADLGRALDAMVGSMETARNEAISGKERLASMVRGLERAEADSRKRQKDADASREYLAASVETMLRAMSALSAGDLGVRLQVDREDDIGKLFRSFNAMAEALRNSKEELTRRREYLGTSVEKMLGVIGAFAEGDLTARLPKGGDDDIGKLFDGFNRAAEGVRRLMLAANETAVAVSTSSSEVHGSASELSASMRGHVRDSQTAAKVLAASTENIKKAAQDAASTAEAAVKNREVALQGGASVKETIARMRSAGESVARSVEVVDGLKDACVKIGAVVKSINRIASRTNLLALNAAIEAARAGEHGKGFAVVASEVKRLAEQTTDATKSVAESVQTIQSATERVCEEMESAKQASESGMASSDRTGDALDRIVEGAAAIRDMVGRVAAAQAEQAEASDGVAATFRATAELAASASDGADRIAHSSENMNARSAELRELLGRFKISGSERPKPVASSR
jgi:methyl-accepting chemotaxis protein